MVVAALLLLSTVGWGLVWVLAGELARSEGQNAELHALVGYWRDEAIALGSTELET